MRSSLPLLLALVVGACATVPPATPQADQEAKRFDAPPPDRGALYLYRSGWFGFLRPVDVATPGTRTRLATNTYIRLDGMPGPAEVTCQVGAGSPDALQIQVPPGQTRYVEVAMRPGLWEPGCRVTEVAPEQGQAAVLSGRRVAP